MRLVFVLLWKSFDLSINFEWDPCWVEFLGCRFFPISTLNISCHSLLACRVSAERSAVKYMEFPLYVTCCFSLAAINIISLCLIFVCVLACFSLVLSCMGLFVPLALDYFLFHVGEFFNYNLFKNFLIPFLFLFFL